MGDLGRMLVVLGGLLLVLGLVLILAGKVNLPIGRLPGDIVIRGKNSTFYFPLILKSEVEPCHWLFFGTWDRG
jgi:DUF2905 family protein